MGSQILTESPSGKKQDFLEASPYWDQATVPVNTWKNKSPYTAKVVSCKRIVGPQATGETCHIILNHQGKMPYWEGQSFGVLPPGTNPKNGKPHTVRLYSIASSRYGDDMSGQTSSLCVRRATYWDPEMGKEDPAKKGVCSNFLCDATAGEQVKMTGPTGKVMLMPEEKADTDYIMVATGTGIAPYRGFIRRLFTETTPAGEAYKGLAWLFLGVPTATPSSTTRSGRRRSRNFPTISASTTRSRARRRTRRAARCTSRTRSRNTLTRSLSASRTAPSCTSAASRA